MTQAIRQLTQEGHPPSIPPLIREREPIMTPSKTFDELGLDSQLMAGIADLGFETPTPVQAAVIPRLLKSSGDFVGLAQTGTGKTAAFGLPVLQHTDLSTKDTQALILCPTRELCLQITRDLKAFGKHKKELRTLAVYGGSPIDKQIGALDKGVHVIVATPGRIHDLLRRKKARLQHVRRVVLDEADEMLNMGFQEDLEAILEQVPDAAQTFLFSATMPQQVAAIAGNYMHNPEEITIGTRNAGAENVSHVCYTVHAKDRYLALKRIADLYPDMYGIVFCRTRIETQTIADKLMKDGYNADSLHGDLSQAQRDRVMQNFRGRGLQMLVATDIAARGLDVNDLTHIINYNLPDDLESYTHRSGRTGRAGKDGMSVAIVHMREKGRIRRIEQIIGKRFEFRKVPSGRDVCKAQLLALIGRVKDVEVDHGQIDSYLPEIQAMLKGMSRDDLIKKFVSLEFNRFLDYYRTAPDLNVNEQAAIREQRQERRKRSTPGGFTRLFINLGKRDRLSPKSLMGLINKVTPGKPVTVSHIVLSHVSTLFEVESSEAERVIDSLSRIEYDDREIRIEPAEMSKGRGPGRRKQGRFQKRTPSRGRPRSHNAARNSKPGNAKRGAKKRNPYKKRK